MMLKVGDKVKIREDLKIGNSYETYAISHGMCNFKGVIAIINSIDKTPFGIYYDLDVDKGTYCWTEEMFEKIEEDNNMKELTFREVIANIKEGEVWEGVDKQILCYDTGIQIKIIDGRAYNGIGFYNDSLFKLKREQYTFEEAFKFFKEGKEIESCYKGDKFKLNLDKKEVTIHFKNDKGEEDSLEVDLKDSCIFSIQHLEDKWYIND